MGLSRPRRPQAAAAALLALVLLVLAPPGPATRAAAAPVPVAASWSATGSLHVARERAAAALLNDGRVLVMGGEKDCQGGPCGYLASSELYNPVTGSWTTGPSMSTARVDFKAVLLGNGKVLAIGGLFGSGRLSADLYDPATNSFSSGGTLAAGADTGFAVVVLDSGRVLVIGGCCSGAPYNQTTQLYDPATNAWTLGPSLSTPRASSTATLMPNGRVLVAGGLDNISQYLSSTEVYNPVTNSFSAGGRMVDSRYSAEAALLPDGQVLILGGTDTTGCLGTSEVYNPASNSFADHQTGLPPRQDEIATPIIVNDGRMLVAGGDCSLTSAELYNPVSDRWVGTAPLAVGRRHHVLVRLHSGLVLAAGGDNFSASSLASSELYRPPTVPSAYATPSPVIRGAGLSIAGFGFRAGETVDISTNGSVLASVAADASGRFTVGFNTSALAAGPYIVRAHGRSSGRDAYFSAPVVAG